MALASAGCEMPSSSYTAGPRPQSVARAVGCRIGICGVYRLCSVMAGGTARPAAAEGEAGHEPGTGWPGPQVAALERGARAHGMPSRPSGQSTAVPKLNLRAFVVEADRSPRPRVTCARINVESGLHYRNKFLR